MVQPKSKCEVVYCTTVHRSHLETNLKCEIENLTSNYIVQVGNSVGPTSNQSQSVRFSRFHLI